MTFIKWLGVGLWERLVETFATLLIVAFKSLYLGPVFYGINWLVSHHGPSLDMWYSFFVAALFFTHATKKTKSDAGKEQAQRPVSPIILPANRWQK